MSTHLNCSMYFVTRYAHGAFHPVIVSRGPKQEMGEAKIRSVRHPRATRVPRGREIDCDTLSFAQAALQLAVIVVDTSTSSRRDSRRCPDKVIR